MRHPIQVLTAALLLLAFIAAPAAAGLFEFAVGVYGGANLPFERDTSAETVIGAKVRVVPPIPFVGFEAWYAHFGYEDPVEVVTQGGDLSPVLDGDGFKIRFGT